MNAQVIPFPQDSIERARETIARLDLHDDATLLDACELLMWQGDWIDHERAKILHAAIIRASVREMNRRHRLVRFLGDALGAAIIFALVFLFLLFTP